MGLVYLLALLELSSGACTAKGGTTPSRFTQRLLLVCSDAAA